MSLFARAPAMTTAQHVAAVLWISFLCAIAMTGIFFSLLDPLTLKLCTPLSSLSRLATYSIGFFVFWFLNLVPAVLAVLFVMPETSGNT